jgi:hypothetical protein
MKNGFLRMSALFLAISTLLSVPALAEWEHRHHHDVGIGVTVYHDQRVPTVLYARQRRDFRPYYAGEVYYRPHHHYHAAYRFPVSVNGGVVYRPYYYCHDRLFEYGYSRPRLAFGVEFSSY